MKLKEGDIFSISVQEKGFGLGQIIKIPNKESISVAIFKEVFEDVKSKALGEIIKECTPLLFGNTFDAKFYHKHWIIVGNDKSNLLNIHLPYYKIGSSPVYIEDFNEKKVRKASKEEIELLMFRKYVAPVRLENALLAYYGLGDWKDDLFNPLLYSYNLESKRLVEGK